MKLPPFLGAIRILSTLAVGSPLREQVFRFFGFIIYQLALVTSPMTLCLCGRGRQRQHSIVLHKYLDILGLRSIPAYLVDKLTGRKLRQPHLSR